MARNAGCFHGCEMNEHSNSGYINALVHFLLMDVTQTDRYDRDSSITCRAL